MEIPTKVLFLAMIIYITSSILLFRYDPLGKYSFGQTTTITLTIFGGVMIVLLLFMASKKSILFSNTPLNLQNLWSIAKITGAILAIIGIFLGIISLFNYFLASPPQTKAFFTVFNVLIFITTILLFLYFVKDIEVENPYFNLLKNTILYIPCLVYDLIDWIKYQYSITTDTAYIILAIDILFITLQKISDKIKTRLKHNKAGNYLLNDPVYLNKMTIIGSFEDMKANNNNKNYSYRYGLSFYVYINPQPPNTNAAYNEFAKIFDYGGKPTLMYKGKDNELKIQVKLNESENKDIYLGNDLKLQKWNHFIINYDGGTLDVILNNELISSNSSIAPYMTLDLVSVGENHGIHGGIKDVIYFREPIIF